jgi:uncharacterized protein
MTDLRRPPAIEGFGAGGFRIEGARHDGAVLILSDQVRSWSGAWTTEAFAEVLSAPRSDVEFVILGAGAALQPVPRELREAFRAAGLGLEVLTTLEAARLYNLVSSDGRRVAVALRPD